MILRLVFLMLCFCFKTVTAIEVRPGIYNIQSKEDENIIVELEADTLSPYLQAQTLITLRLYRDSDSFDAAMSFPELSEPITSKNVVLRNIDISNRRYRKYKDNRLYTVTERQYAVYPEQSGELTIGPSVFKGHIVQGGTIKFAEVKSNILKLNVRPIPETFSGNIWIPARSVELYQDFQPTNKSIEIGKPISRNLFISATGLGSGHIPSFYSTQVPGFRVYPRQTQREELEQAESGLIAVLQQEVALVPIAVGQYKIPEIKVPWWNTIKDKEEIAFFPGKTITILPAVKPIDETSSNDKQDYQKDNANISATDPAEDKSTNSVFLILSCLIAVLMIFLAIFVFRVFAVKKTALFLSKQSLNAILKLCYENDAKQASIQIIAYFNQCLPELKIHSLLDLSTFFQADLKSELEALNTVLYSNDVVNWRGERLASLLKDWRNYYLNQESSKKESLLPELHPLSLGK